MNRPRRLPDDWRVGLIPRPACLAGHEGEWVAVKDRSVVAHAVDSRELVRLVRALGPDGEGAVVEYVMPPSDSVWIPSFW